MTTIVLCDNHHVARRGLRTVLEAQTEFQVIGEADNGIDALNLVEHLKPDVLVSDIMMAGIDGFEVTRQVNRRSPHTIVIILSVRGEESCVVEALRCGAKAYVLKTAPMDELIHAVYEATRGNLYLSSPFSQEAIKVYAQKAENLDHKLTPREREIVLLVAQGSSNRIIAERLFLSCRTVENHRANAMHKLGLQNKNELMRFSVEHNLIPDSQSVEKI